MKGVYTARDLIVDVSASENLMYLKCPTDALMLILSARVTSPDTTADEMLDCRIARVASGTQAGGATVVPKPDEEADQAWSAYTGEVCVSGNTPITGLTLDSIDDSLGAFAQHIKSGWHYTPDRFKPIMPGDEVVLHLETAITECDLYAEIEFQMVG